MPTLIDRARTALADTLLGPERARLQETFGILLNAYQSGPWEMSPQDLVTSLKEIDPWALQDALDQVGWDLLTTYGRDTTAERQRAVAESRRLFKYSPLAQWSVWAWTAWGIGDKVLVTVKQSQEQVQEQVQEKRDNKGLNLADPDAVAQEFWGAERSAGVLGDAAIGDNSNGVLVDGNLFWAVYASQQDGEATVAALNPDEIVGIVTHPEDSSRTLFYKRQFQDAKNVTQTWYYPDWRVFFSGELDAPYLGDEPDKEGNRLTLAQAVLDAGSVIAGRPGKTDKVCRAQAEELGGQGERTGTAVCIKHLAHNRKDLQSLWGWPLSTTSRAATVSHKKFVDSRLTVAIGKTMYLRRIQVDQGSRGIKALRALRGTALSAANLIDTNPPPASGSEDIVNRATDVKELPMTTGASDAKADNEMLAWWALIGFGLFPTSAGLDTSRWATALEMDKVQAMVFARYQAFLSTAFRDLVTIVLRYREKFAGVSYGDYTVEVNVDSFSLADFKGISQAIGQLLQALAPLARDGMVDTTALRPIVAALLLPTLQALGIRSAADLTREEAFGISTGEPRGDEAAKPPPAAAVTMAQPGKQGGEGQAGHAVERVAEMILENMQAGEMDWQAVAEFALAELADNDS